MKTERRQQKRGGIGNITQKFVQNVVGVRKSVQQKKQKEKKWEEERRNHISTVRTLKCSPETMELIELLIDTMKEEDFSTMSSHLKQPKIKPPAVIRPPSLNAPTKECKKFKQAVNQYIFYVVSVKMNDILVEMFQDVNAEIKDNYLLIRQQQYQYPIKQQSAAKVPQKPIKPKVLKKLQELGNKDWLD